MSSHLGSLAAVSNTGTVAAIFHSLERSERLGFVTRSQSVTWVEWIASVEQLAQQYSQLRRGRTGLVLRPSPKSYALLVALSWLDCDVFLLDAGISGPAIKEFAEQYRLDATIDPSSAIDGEECCPDRSARGTGRGHDFHLGEHRSTEAGST